MKTSQVNHKPCFINLIFHSNAAITVTLFLLLTCCFASVTWGKNAPAATSGNIVFLPFTVITQPAKPYLQDGLTEILASRLAKRTGFIPIHKTSQTRMLAGFMERGDQQGFKNILMELSADYLVLASLEQQKNGYDIMVYVFDKEHSGPASFSRTIETLNKAIPAVDDIAGEITAVVFNKTTPEQLVQSTPQETGMAGFQTTHPDRAYREGLYTKSPATNQPTPAQSTLPSWHSTPIEPTVVAMDVGDLDGDGLTEIVLLSKGSIFLYRFSADQFQPIAEQTIPSYLTPHALRLADLDHNGLLEIYLTASKGIRASSFIFEWDGKSFITRSSDIPYYIRPGLNPEGEAVLIGQKSGGTEPTMHSFYELSRSGNGSLKPEKEISVPDAFNLFDFIRADLDNDDVLEFIGCTEKNKLVILNQSGDELWKSESTFGASKDFLGNSTMGKEGAGFPVYFHSRIIVKDVNGDDTPEIIISNNRQASSKYLSRFRYFSGSSVNFLNWNGTKVSIRKTTGIIASYIPDFQVTTGKQGSPRLLYVENENGSSLLFWKSEKSMLHLQELGQL